MERVRFSSRDGGTTMSATSRLAGQGPTAASTAQAMGGACALGEPLLQPLGGMVFQCSHRLPVGERSTPRCSWRKYE